VLGISFTELLIIGVVALLALGPDKLPQLLKTIGKAGLGDQLFYDWRYDADGNPLPDFILNQPSSREAKILLAGDNFGCGSSREHAPWALYDYGIRIIIAPSFADIFFNNCFKNGILPVVLPAAQVDALFARAGGREALQLAMDLPRQVLGLPDGTSIPFEVDPFRKHCLLEGLDDIGLTLQHVDAIRAYEERRRQEAPWLFA